MAARGFGKWNNIAFKKHNAICSKSLRSGIVLLNDLGHWLSSGSQERFVLKGPHMTKLVHTIAVIACLCLSLPSSAQNTQGTRGTNKIEPLPRDLEIQLALSALPPHLRDNATVYVLNPDKGFEVARQGTNGFRAFVARTGDDTFRGSWPLKQYRDDILYPVSFDEAGVKAGMRVFFDAAEMRAKGTPPEEL